MPYLYGENDAHGGAASEYGYGLGEVVDGENDGGDGGGEEEAPSRPVLLQRRHPRQQRHVAEERTRAENSHVGRVAFRIAAQAEVFQQ